MSSLSLPDAFLAVPDAGQLRTDLPTWRGSVTGSWGGEQLPIWGRCDHNAEGSSLPLTWGPSTQGPQPKIKHRLYPVWVVQESLESLHKLLGVMRLGHGTRDTGSLGTRWPTETLLLWLQEEKQLSSRE